MATTGSRPAGTYRQPALVVLAAAISFVFMFVFMASGTTSALTDEGGPGEYQVKAAFLYNFAKFAEFPTDAFSSQSSPFVFGIIGDDPFGITMDRAVNNKLINGRPVTVRRFTSPDRIGECHVLFISNSESPRLGEILNRLSGRPVLAVGEMDGFARRGGTIGFVLVDNRVRFEINTVGAERARILISSKLLTLATAIYGN